MIFFSPFTLASQPPPLLQMYLCPWSTEVILIKGEGLFYRNLTVLCTWLLSDWMMICELSCTLILLVVVYSFVQLGHQPQ